MAGEHIGEKSDRQGNGLHHRGEDLDDGHNRLEETGDLGEEDFLIVVLRTEDIDGEEGEQGEDQRDGDVAGEVGAAGEEGDDAEEVVQEDEQEGHTQVGREFAVVAFADVVAGHIVDHHHKGFHQGGAAPRGFFEDVVLFVPSRRAENQPEQQGAAEHQRGDVFRNRNVDHRTLAARHFDDLAFVRAFGRDLQTGECFAVVQLVRQEAVEAFGFAVYDNRQRNGDMVLVDRRNVPLIRIADVLENHFYHIHLLFVLLRCSRYERQSQSQ